MRQCGNCKWFRRNNKLDGRRLTDGYCAHDGLFVDRSDEHGECWRPLPATVEEMRAVIGGLK